MSTVPFDQLDGVIWMNGQMVDWPDAKLHVLSHGLHYASSVFEGERMYGGEIFKLNEHTQRLFNSAEILGFEIPYTVEEFDQDHTDIVGHGIEHLMKTGVLNLLCREGASHGHTGCDLF